MKISLLTSSHKYDDDRLYHHFAKTLVNNGHTVQIISSEVDLNLENDFYISSFNASNLTRKEKIEIYLQKLSAFKPEIIICSEPITVLAAKKYSKIKNTKIIFDITEWYPSKKNLNNHVFVTKPIYFFIYLGIFLYACKLTDGFILGEYYKGIIPKMFFKKKAEITIPYFPNKNYIQNKKPKIEKDILKLSYSGNLSIEKGLLNFLDVLKELIRNKPSLKIHVKLIGRFNPNEKEKCFTELDRFPENVNFSIYPLQELTKYVELINDTDVFMDLRTLDFENKHCLPIKIFYFMALQRPVIYTDSIAIRKEIEIEKFGNLVNPKDSKKIAELILNYQENVGLYESHCLNARDLFETKHNWDIVEKPFINFIESL